ncbi:PGPGW domain-containing protein [Thiocapsa bogorovii]|jgi:hypothetical protein|uniref:PGPGW domain-containing protein n=1 Tax=Thiocapsa bogorovii TaxID=521689 RepID=UPI001E55E9BF|nr:PGPGW domain-containing protein [Thiocapsa bogorovii]UHD18671.1 PGPGW domain-containing protein [Thiocapsa bogorovii]
MIDMSWVEAHQGLLLSLAGLSVLMFVGSLIALPFLLARIPEDYFVDPERHSARLKRLHPVAYLSLRLLKNLVGWILVLAGILMLVLPGQGILTIIMGLVLSDFPGKFALERRLASKGRVLNGINWIRRRSGHAPLVPPQI